LSEDFYCITVMRSKFKNSHHHSLFWFTWNNSYSVSVYRQL